MLSRALSLATVTLLIGCLTAGVARAVENLDAGKSPSQIFSNTCSACHKSPRGLLKSVSASSLPGFLRQHYTTGTDMASVLSSYLISNGAADPRYQSKDQPKQKDAKQDGRPDQPDRLGRRQPPAAPAQEASRPDADGATPQGEGARPGRDAKRSHGRTRRPMPPNLQMGRPRCRPRPTANRASGRSRADVASPPPKNRRKPSRQPPAMPRRKMRRGMPPKLKPPRPILPRPILPRPIRQDRPIKTDAIKGEGDKPASEAAKPAGERSRREADPRPPRSMLPKENAGSEPTPLRPDPVPPVTPAPPASAATAPEPAAGSSAAAPPPVTATAPAPPVAPAGAPVPPISR